MKRGCLWNRSSLFKSLSCGFVVGVVGWDGCYILESIGMVIMVS